MNRQYLGIRKIAKRLIDKYQKSNDLFFLEYPEIERGDLSLATIDYRQERRQLEIEIHHTEKEYKKALDHYLNNHG